MGTFNLLMAKTQEDAESVQSEINKQLMGLAQAKTQSPWFNGEAFSLVDIAAAPFFVRAAFFKKQCNLDLLQNFPEMQQWSDDLLARQSVQDSIVDGFEKMLTMRMESNGSFINA